MNANSQTSIPSDWSILSLADNDPFPIYERLRHEKGNIFWDPGISCWVILSHELCARVELDEKTFRTLAPSDDPPVSYEIKGDLKKQALPTLTGEEHARMRKFYLRFVGPLLMPTYRTEHVLPVLNNLLDRLSGLGACELAAEYGDKITVRILASLFGLPWKDDRLMDDMARWNDAIIASFAMRFSDEKVNQPALRASSEVDRLLRPIVIARKDERTGDFISNVWTYAEEDLGEVEVEQIVGIVRDIALGAGDTTKNAIVNLIYAYLSNEDMRQAVSPDNERSINAMVEETLRLVGPLPMRFRKANTEIELGGITIKKDDRLCLMHAAASRDPEHYGCPHAFDLSRKRPTDHFQFSVGPRICIAAPFARLMMRESLKTLLERHPDVRLDTNKERPTFRGLTPRSYRPLHALL
ncbi:MAG: cytochrome P450 [Mesorhizobium sp.]|uniref:cytochrome P450 n=1 Tax=Mesorhizobium sp. TaxID=1871066 RepID=UPI0012017BBE|nr:cytochrome P450 [Mesorhizobium sp.]TIR52787.1 MAG: cytochrome P450 [Mesorhizobium sp.]